MKLFECEPYDLLVVDDDGAATYVELGALNGTAVGTKKNTKGWKPDYALVTTYDPETLATVNGTWRTMDVDTEVLTVYESAKHRRENKRAVGAYGHNDEIDPMLSRDKRGGF